MLRRYPRLRGMAAINLRPLPGLFPGRRWQFLLALERTIDGLFFIPCAAQFLFVSFGSFVVKFPAQ
jgi:hypothetical protein